jgi:DNA-binding transcriptional ArsR family regulator
MSQPLISHHLAILRQTGFVRSRGEGARTYYSIDWDEFDEKAAAFADAVASLRERDQGPSRSCG